MCKARGQTAKQHAQYFDFHSDEWAKHRMYLHKGKVPCGTFEQRVFY